MMKEITQALGKRRKLMFIILVAIALLLLVVNYFYTMTPSTYFDASTRYYIIYFLIFYKLVELNVLYWWFFTRAHQKLKDKNYDEAHKPKFEKSAKRFFMLVPHGSVIFGFISYKLSGDIHFFFLFLAIATIALLLVNPKDKL